jgi:hypothetical protein
MVAKVWAGGKIPRKLGTTFGTTGHQSVFIAYSDASLLAVHVSSQCFVLQLLAFLLRP